jgi:uncharacterized repeat protein (TIGR01451 family)
MQIKPFSRAANRMLAWLVALLVGLVMVAPAQAANCNYATSQGATGPVNWQTYCWLDFSGYNDAAARSASGQPMSYTLPDGTVMTFTLKISGAAITGVASPSWSGAPVGNTAFIGIGGRPILYQTVAGTTTAVMSGIVLTPPVGASAITNYLLVAGDGESTNSGESFSFQTNGGNWVQLDQAGPISGSLYPTATGLGTQTYTVNGAAGAVGAYIVGSSTPTSLTTTMVGGGLQGVMFAVRFASIRLNMQISGARADPSDQFKFDINATTTGTTLASGTSTGTGLGPFSAVSLTTSTALPITLAQSMAAGSANATTHYQTSLTCTNSVSSSTSLPTNVLATSYSFGALQFGDIVNCVFTNTPFPHLKLTKALAATGRQFSGDQFALSIVRGTTTVAATTTTGTGAIVGSGSTPQVQAVAGQTYAMREAAAGTAVLAQYTATMACTNASSSSTTPLPASVGGSVSPVLGDVISCTITNTKRAANATLTLMKTSAVMSDPVNGTTSPYVIPGAIVRYTIAVTNTGPTAVDANSVLLIDSLPSQLAVGTSATPTFTQGTPSSALTFNAGTDIRFSNAAVAPTTFAGCTYTPTSAYDPAVTFVCLNPKGSMAGSSGTPPGFSITLQAQVK